VDAGKIVERINATGKTDALYVPDKGCVAEKLHGIAGVGDLVIFMGAGDIWESARDFTSGVKS
jgi:UDP-N-acetylmuramate-alanine ligase